MAKTNTRKTTKGVITLDFTEAYNRYQEYLNEPCEGTMQIPEPEIKKPNIWQRIKNWFKKK